MSKKLSKTVHAGITREEADKAMAEYASAHAKHESLMAKMEMEMAKIREKYNEQIIELAFKCDECFTVVSQYATENRQQLFQDKKKVEGVHGSFGFRTGSPKLKLYSGFSWPGVVERCKEFLPDYVKTTHDVAKSKLLADREKEGMKELFEKVGVYVDRDESFYIDPK